MSHCSEHTHVDEEVPLKKVKGATLSGVGSSPTVPSPQANAIVSFSFVQYGRTEMGSGHETTGKKFRSRCDVLNVSHVRHFVVQRAISTFGKLTVLCGTGAMTKIITTRCLPRLAQENDEFSIAVRYLKVERVSSKQRNFLEK